MKAFSEIDELLINKQNSLSCRLILTDGFAMSDAPVTRDKKLVSIGDAARALAQSTGMPVNRCRKEVIAERTGEPRIKSGRELIEEARLARQRRFELSSSAPTT